MAGRILVGVVVAGVLAWAWKQIGFIRMETPLADLKRKSDIFAATEPKYRRTQERNVWKTRTSKRAEARRRA
jgi:hypothetical protein